MTRESADEAVRRAFSPRPRTCARCGKTAETAHRACPHCGADYVVTAHRRPWRAPLTAALVIGALAGSGVFIAVNLDESVDLARKPQRSGAELNLLRQQAERVRSARAERPAGRLGPLRARRARRALVVAVEAAITRDARARAREGTLGGPIRETICRDATGGGEPATDLHLDRGVLTCVAITSLNDAPRTGRARIEYIGHPFRAEVDFRRFRFRWQRVFPNSGV